MGHSQERGYSSFHLTKDLSVHPQPTISIMSMTQFHHFTTDHSRYAWGPKLQILLVFGLRTLDLEIIGSYTPKLTEFADIVLKASKCRILWVKFFSGIQCSSATSVLSSVMTCGMSWSNALSSRRQKMTRDYVHLSQWVCMESNNLYDPSIRWVWIFSAQNLCIVYFILEHIWCSLILEYVWYSPV